MSLNGDIFTQKDQGMFLTGARCVVRINGKILYFANTISWEINNFGKPLYVLDSVLPKEIIPSFIQVTGSLGGFVIPGMSLSALNLQSNPDTLLLNKYISIEARDIKTDLILLKVDSAFVTRRSEHHSVQMMSEAQYDWVAIGWKEAGNDGSYGKLNLNS